MSAGTHGTPEPDTFPVRFLNIFVDYPLGQMHVGDKLWTNWNEAPMPLWQTQLNFAVWCTSSACRVSSAHLNYTNHPMIRSVYRFHVYYHVRRIWKKLQTPLPQETTFNAADNPHTESEFFKICEDYGVPNDPMRYRDEKFYWTCQHGVGWPDDYIGPDSMTRWILEKLVGFTDIGLLKISKSVRAYTYLILSSQASEITCWQHSKCSHSLISFLNNFENVVSRRLDIQEDIKCYQNTLSYASSKVNYSVGEHLYMLPSDMTLKIRLGTVGYNNKIRVSDGNFSLGKNDEVNLAVPAIKGHKTNSLETPAIKNHKTNSLETPAIESHSNAT